MSNSRPIGVFDSGLGGLTLVHQIQKLLPNERIIYLGDTARVPYGTRSEAIIKKFSLQNATFLANKDVKCIVVACNTASAVARDYIERKISLPVIDVITPINEYVDFKKLSFVGVIGTRATINSGAYEKVIQRESQNTRIFAKSCPLLVPLIEAGETRGKILNLVIAKYLKDLKNKKLDCLILGCTHYPLIKNSIRAYMGPVKLIDPAFAAAVRLKKFLNEFKMESSSKEKGGHLYFVTDVASDFQKAAEMFMSNKLEGLVQKVDLE